MDLVKKILFPVTFSTSCTAMASYVQRASSLFGAPVTLIHVVDPRDLDFLEGMSLFVRPLSEMRDEHRSNQVARLSKFLKTLLPEDKCPRVVVSGDPATEITAFAEAHGFDIIIMPTHTGRFRERLLGSTTARVIDSARCPVLTSTHAENIVPRSLEHRRWLCAFSRGQESISLLKTAMGFSDQAGARLSLIHVIDIGVFRAQIGSDHEDLYLQGVDAESSVVNSFATEHAPGRQNLVIVGSPKEELLTAVSSSQVDLLIIGRTPGKQKSGRLADLSYALVRDSPCPVLTV